MNSNGRSIKDGMNYDRFAQDFGGNNSSRVASIFNYKLLKWMIDENQKIKGDAKDSLTRTSIVLSNMNYGLKIMHNFFWNLK